MPEENQPRSADLPAALFTVVLFLRVVMAPSVHEWAGFAENAALALLVLYVFLKDPFSFRPGSRLLAGAALFYFAALFFTVPWSLTPADSLHVFLFHSGDLFVFLAAMSLGTRRMKWFLSALLLALVFSAAFALRQNFGGFEKTLASDQVTEYARATLLRGRVFGLTMSPDMLAVGLAAAIPVLLAFMLAQRKRAPGPWSKLGTALNFFVLALFVYVLFLTRSLGGWLAAGAGLFVFVFMLSLESREGPFRRHWKKLAVLLIIVVLAGSAAIVFLRGGHFFNLEKRHNPLVMRLHNWHSAIELFAEFPVTGAGVGQYGLGMLKHRNITGNEAQHAHNSLLDALSEAGVLGFSGLLLFFAAFLRRGFSMAGVSPSGHAITAENRLLLTGLFAGATALLLHSLIDYSLQVPECAVLLWFAGGLLASTEESAKNGPGAKRKIASAVVAGALLMSSAVNLYHMHAESLELEAEQAAAKGDWDEALAVTDKALEWRPDNEEMLVLKARGLAFSRGQRDIEKARQALRRAIFINPRRPFLYEYYGHLVKTDSPERAGKLFRKAVSLYPNSLDLNLDLGKWLLKKRKYDEAEQVLLHAAKCGNANGEVLFQLSVIYFRKGDLEKSEIYLERSAFAPPEKAERAKRYLNFMLGRGYMEEARMFVEEWKRKNPEHAGKLTGLEKRTD